MTKAKLYIIFSTAINFILLIALVIISDGLKKDIDLINQGSGNGQILRSNQKQIGGDVPADAIVKSQKNIARINLAVDDKGFSSKGFQINAEDRTIVTIENKDKKAHSFTIDDLKVDSSINPGERKEVIIEGQFEKSGILKFFSKTEGDSADMFSGVIMALKQENTSTTSSE